MAPSVMASRVALARRVGDLPEIGKAVTGGLIGFEAAAAIARVASPVTVELWIERAEGRTVKVLREEVAAAEMFARVEGIAPRSVLPPDREMMTDVHDLERSVIASLTDGSRMSGGRESGEVDEAMPELPTTGLRLSLSEDTGRFWRALEAVHARLVKGSESFVAFVVRAVARSWSGVLGNDVAYREIYLRDRWRCASPVCRSRNVTPHHVKFRAYGGGDEPTNLISLCERCHLELVHGGRLRVVGAAPGGLRWAALGGVA